MTEIFKCIAGSQLYGTATKDSDTDYKSVYLPTKRQILLGKRDQVVSVSSGGTKKNTAEDVDTEAFELQRYLSLLTGMQTVAVELLFVGGDALIVDTPLFQRIYDNRDKLLSKNGNAFVGYCKAQSIRYGLRGDRLNTFNAVLDVMKSCKGKTVEDCKRDFMSITGATIIPKMQPGGTIVDYLDVYGRQVPVTIKLAEAIKVYQKPVDESGKRAQAAAANDGADLKALYHAYRIADEGVHLFRDGFIPFPSRKRDFLRMIREGMYSQDYIMERFEERRAYMEELIPYSSFADEPDRKWVDDFVCEVYEDIVKRG